MEGIRVASMVGSVFTAGGALHPQPWASDSTSPAPLQAHLLHPAPLSRKPSTALWKQEERERKRQREGEREVPSVQCGFSADLERPLPPPPSSWHSWAQRVRVEAGSQEGSCGTPHLASYPPQAPLCAPGGLRPNHRQHRHHTSSRGGTKGWKDERGPTGIKRCQAGGQRAGSSGCRRLLRAAGHDWLDACPSVPLSIQGGSSLGGSEAGRALLKSFLCVCVLIT